MNMLAMKRKALKNFANIVSSDWPEAVRAMGSVESLTPRQVRILFARCETLVRGDQHLEDALYEVF